MNYKVIFQNGGCTVICAESKISAAREVLARPKVKIVAIKEISINDQKRIPLMSDERWNEIARQNAIDNLIQLGLDPTEDNINYFHAQLKGLPDSLGERQNSCNIIQHNTVLSHTLEITEVVQ